jgi:flagellar hook-associated protein 3 FlgL
LSISTSEFYNQAVQTMNSQQSQMNELYEEISSGQALSTPADNPLGAAQAVQLSMSSATISQYSTNQSSALTSLQLEDSTLSSVTNVMESIDSIIVSAGDPTLNDSNRAAMAQQLEGYRNQLLQLANTTGATGSYIFAGFQGSTQPFVNAPGGGVTYQGDTGTQQVQVTDTTQVATNDNGASVFMSVPPIGTSPVSAGMANNTGTGTIGGVTVSDPSATTNSDNYTINFTGTNPLQYTVTDTTAGTTTPPATYTAGSPIALGTGMSVTISGTPNSGDAFTVSPANAPANSDVFQTIDSVIAALQTPADGNSAAGATLTNALATGLTSLQNSIANVSVVQASVGGREQELQSLQTMTQSSSVQVQNNLSNVTSTNMTQAISQLEELQNTLQASQMSFAKIQGMSLFQYLNG